MLPVQFVSVCLGRTVVLSRPHDIPGAESAEAGKAVASMEGKGIIGMALIYIVFPSAQQFATA